MADEEKGVVAAGFSLLWRRQGILWWVFVVNFVCGALGTAPAALQLSRALASQHGRTASQQGLRFRNVH